MQEHEKTLLSLLLMGAIITLGKMLTSTEPITLRLFVGRIVLGSAVSVAAGSILIWIPGLSPLAVIGLGAALGIAGHQGVELWLRRRGSDLLTGKVKNDTQ
ncbi:phage holin family protein [Photorhabdus tasmaniensis]|uniref:Holin n=1 Tax=Photorhabdus tasmaniensis TaxID=1004159 RepID=A0ABX0GFP4_9GAMM|nr:phage holin family protein [Photorhabdus tasmaniensis]NHB87187.1 holin [Photorhabdus tasmaniensis]